MKRLFLLIQALVFCGIAYAIAPADTVHIYFKLNEEKLYPPAKTKLDSLVYNDIMNSNTSVLIVGYADYLGSEEHNLGLSQRRAKAIQQYLVHTGMPASNIKLCIGKGEVSRKKTDAEGYAPDRRVDVVITKMTDRITAARKGNIRVGELPPVTNKPVEVPTVKKSGIIATSANPPPPLPTSTKSTKAISSKPTPILSTMKVGQTIRLENIYFLMGRHVVTDESFPQLDKLYEVLDDYPTIKIQIEGHICCLRRGFDAEDDDTHENVLSLNRARFIYEYLIKKGIDKDRMKYIGFGRTRPLISPEVTSKDEDLNRRVEIRILER